MNEQIQHMIDWIEATLKSDFSLEGLSSCLGYSPYYCSFKFHQATGITIRRYVHLRKLYLSTDDLKSNRRIIDVAVDYGYSSQEAYSRAFKSVFGLNPREFQLNEMPVQSFIKLTLEKEGEWNGMIISAKEVEELKRQSSKIFDKDVLNVLNGQFMYEQFKEKRLMGDSDYVPFNEAMCVNATTNQVFDEEFVKTRAQGHNDSVENYFKKVMEPLDNLFTKQYKCIVLWFGEDMFCQMNLLTMLAYLEQSNYKGEIFLYSFREDEFKVNVTELKLGAGTYSAIYKEVLVKHQRPTNDVFPVMYQAIEIYLDMLKEDNAVVKYIAKNKDVPTMELVNRLFTRFPTIGYGDTQYLELIHKNR